MPTIAHCPTAQGMHRAYLVITAIFISTLCVINFINISHLIEFKLAFFTYHWTIVFPVGILPYPITFLCTDIVSECYGKQAANQLVTLGLIANLFMALLIWLVGVPDFSLTMSTQGHDTAAMQRAFFQTMRYMSLAAISASMLAYLLAQYLDVMLFHLLKRLCSNKHLWLRNNVSTIISQWVDTCCVLSCSYWMTHQLGWTLPAPSQVQYSLLSIIIGSYGYKCLAALIDTIPCYFFVRLLKPSNN